MILPYFEDVVRGVEAKLGAAGPGDPVARKRLTLELARLGVRLFDGQHQVAWCGIATPYDLLAAMDVTPCFVEFVGATLSSTGMAGPMLEAAEQSGFPTDSCAYHRAVLAADEAGLMPDADLVVGTSLPCSGGMAVIEQLAHRHAWPLMLVHVPPEEGEVAQAYLTEQYRSLVTFVEERTGRPLDPARLRETVERSNRTRELLVEVYALAGAVPTPA
ncbi:MAG: 2-hydroxyacyl-CoA dehydratase family protein, partial [Myxococcota bacterium]|nr:2-hydroxyacyl-CoA dehydratase family protein [Myxococcota bacterium]